MKTVLITGGSGLVGRHLCVKLELHGYAVSVLSRSGKQMPGVTNYLWDVDNNKIDNKAIETADFGTGTAFPICLMLSVQLRGNR